MVFSGSRYQNVGTANLTTGGVTTPYLLTRYIGPTPAYIGHTVVDADRLDLVAYQYFNDPTRFWRICDANIAMWPDDLLVPGTVIAIPPSQG